METYDGWEPTISIPYSKWVELMKQLDEIFAFVLEGIEIRDEIKSKNDE